MSISSHNYNGPSYINLDEHKQVAKHLKEKAKERIASMVTTYLTMEYFLELANFAKQSIIVSKNDKTFSATELFTENMEKRDATIAKLVQEDLETLLGILNLNTPKDTGAFKVALCNFYLDHINALNTDSWATFIVALFEHEINLLKLAHELLKDLSQDENAQQEVKAQKKDKSNEEYPKVFFQDDLFRRGFNSKDTKEEESKPTQGNGPEEKKKERPRNDVKDHSSDTNTNENSAAEIHSNHVDKKQSDEAAGEIAAAKLSTDELIAGLNKLKEEISPPKTENYSGNIDNVEPYIAVKHMCNLYRIPFDFTKNHDNDMNRITAILRGYKVSAPLLHPDKNKDNKAAQEAFVDLSKWKARIDLQKEKLENQKQSS